MPAPIIPITFQNPGSRGLNSQDSTNYLDVTWATELKNAVFDDAGRIANRKGWTKLTTSSALVLTISNRSIVGKTLLLL